MSNLLLPNTAGSPRITARRTVRRRLLALSLSCTLAALAGCAQAGESSADKSATNAADKSGTSVRTAEKNPQLAAMLPEKFRKAGVITVMTDASYPPMEFYDSDNKTIIGLDPDLGAAIGQVLGVEMRFQNATFDGIIASIQAGRGDLAMTSISDTPERQKQVDFIDYLSGGAGVMVKAGNPEGISGYDDLCGHSVAVETGTNSAESADAAGKKCVQDGKSPVDVQRYVKANDSTLALDSGRADAILSDALVEAYAIQQTGGKFEKVGEQINVGATGIVVAKQNTELRDAVAGALRQLQEDGIYEEIFAKWNFKDGMLEGAPINAGKARE